MGFQRTMTIFFVALLSVVFVPGQSGDGSIGIHGRVTDSGGAPLPGAKVSAVQSQEGWQRIAYADESGRFYLQCLHDGSYDLRFELKGFYTQTVSGIEYAFPNVLRINQSMSLGTKIRAPLPRRGLSIFVQDQHGGALSNVEVSVRQENHEIAGGLTSVCGRSFFDLGKGNYVVVLEAHGYKSVTLPITLDESKLLLTQTLKVTK